VSILHQKSFDHPGWVYSIRVYTLYLHSHSPYILSVESQIFLQLIEISKLECLIWLQPFIAKFFVLIMVWCCRCCKCKVSDYEDTMYIPWVKGCKPILMLCGWHGKLTTKYYNKLCNNHFIVQKIIWPPWVSILHQKSFDHQLIEISKLECLIWLQPFIAKFFVLIMVWCCRCCSSVNRTLILVDRSYWIFNINILGTELRLVLILGTNHFQTRGPKCKNRFFLCTESYFIVH
jgi:hypothetical protein